MVMGGTITMLLILSDSIRAIDESNNMAARTTELMWLMLSKSQKPDRA
jgi:hypothetical protein